MTRKNPMVEENDEKDLEVGHGPKDWAAGIPGVLHSMKPAIEHMGLNRTRKTVMKMNQKDGFDCPSCAWPDPHHRKAFEFCENGAKAVTWEATPVVIADVVLGGTLGQRAAEPLGVLAWHAGPAHRTGAQAGSARTTTSR